VQPDLTHLQDLDQLAARIAKKRRLAHITRRDLAFEAGVALDVIERIETGRPVAHEDLIAVLDTIAAVTTAEIRIPAPRAEQDPGSANSA